jgi:hypothetical protein
MDAVDGGQQLNSKELSFGQLRKRGRKLKLFSVNHSFGMKEKQKHGAVTARRRSAHVFRSEELICLLMCKHKS